ncbi:MAG: winged helix-turn-helix domain-containing protein [bacterium]
MLKASDNRYKILKLLNEGNVLTPTEISKKSQIVVNHVSNFLKELRENGLVECLNEKDKRGRLYQITKLGKKVIELM